MGQQTAGVGHFTIPTAPAAGTSCTSGAANTFTTTYVQLIASTAAAIFITGIHLNFQTTSKPTYVAVQLATGAAASETIVDQQNVPLGVTSGAAGTFANCYVPIIPPIPVANGTRIAVKTADSVGSLAALVSLTCINQSNVADDGVAVATVTTVTNQLTAAAVAAGVWKDAVSGDFTTASSIGKALYISNIAPGASGGHMISGSNAGTTTFGAFTVTGAMTFTGNVVLSDGLTISAPSTLNRAGLDIAGNGTGAGIKVVAGGTGVGFSIAGGGTSGDGIKVTTTSGHGMNLAPVGTSMHGLFVTGGNGGTSDGIKAVAGTGGTDIRAVAITGTLATVTTLTNLPAITANWLTAAGINAAALNGKGDWATTNPTNLTAAQIAAGVWTDTVAADFTTALSIGKSVMNGVALGTGLTINAYTGNTAQSGDAFARLGAPAGASTAADIAAVKSDSGAIKTQTDKMAFTVANQIDANVLDWKSATAPAMTGDAFARIGVAGVGLTNLGDARIANLDAAVSTRSTYAGGAVASVTAAVTVTGTPDVNIAKVAGTTVHGSGTTNDPWGP